MAALLHDPAIRASLSSRVERLHPESPRQWGSLWVDQMLWHVNASFRIALGEIPTERADNVLTRSMVRWLVFYAPWPKGGTPTLKEMRARERYDFERERERLRELMEHLAAKPLHEPWTRHPAFGPMTGAQWSRLQCRHVDHHLRQFGA